jgi:SPP1 family predicted phage head-tail adaptor
MIDAGKLRERVTIQQASESRTAMGEVVQSWATYSERWASVEGISSRELLQMGQAQTEASHRVRLRYVDGLTASMRLQWRGRTLEIVSLLEHDNRTEHELLCQEAM